VPAYYGRQHIEDFDAAIIQDCPNGCLDSAQPALVALEKQGHDDFNVARAMWITGGAIAVTGFVLVVLNQPHLEHAPVIAPIVGPDHVGASIVGVW
jgi:hypothetical protein